MNLTLSTHQVENATLGSLVAPTLALFTIELPWEDNASDQSCVPPGIYELIPYLSPKHGATWRLHNPALNVYGTSAVPEGGRSEIEIHAANWARQLLGCIGVGLASAPMLDPQTDTIEPAVQSSQAAFGRLLALLGPMSEGHLLTVVREQFAGVSS